MLYIALSICQFVKVSFLVVNPLDVHNCTEQRTPFFSMYLQFDSMNVRQEITTLDGRHLINYCGSKIIPDKIMKTDVNL